jgi:hypothetical protein
MRGVTVERRPFGAGRHKHLYSLTSIGEHIMKQLIAATTCSTLFIAASSASATGVSWANGGFQYDTGAYPSIALGATGPGNSNAQQIEVHEGNQPADWVHGGTYDDDDYGSGFAYQNGFFPFVAGDGANNFVEVHQGGLGGVQPLWWIVFHETNEGGNNFAISSTTNNGNNRYDSGGTAPQVAVYTDTNGAYSALLEVHNGTAGSGPLWIRTGSQLGPVSNWTGVSFNAGHEYISSGFNPTIAVGVPSEFLGVTSLMAIEVHQAGSGFGNLYITSAPYEVGASTINIGGNSTLMASGSYANPSVALCGNTFIVTYQDSNGNLYSEVADIGFSNGGYTFQWVGGAQQYDTGDNPRIACDAYGQGIEVHNGEPGGGNLWAHLFTWN